MTAPVRTHGSVRPASASGGFAVAVVVFLLFAIGVAGAASYQVVRLEAELARQTEDAAEALTVASAGLDRFVGESYGVPGDSVTYTIGDGEALVRTRKLAEVDSVTDLYLIRSTGRVTDPRFPDFAASRTVSQYALLNKDPLGIHAALMVAAGTVRVRGGWFSNTEIEGDDLASPADCPAGGLYNRTGLANTGNYTTSWGGSVDGSPDHENFGSFQAIADSAQVRWDVLSSPSFAIANDNGAFPNYWAIPTDSFPVVRVASDITVSLSNSGRGVLIVPGSFDATFWFDWDGVILAGELEDINAWGGRVRGMVIAGFNGQQGTVEIRGMSVVYDSCRVLDAMASIAYLEPVSSTWWQEY